MSDNLIERMNSGMAAMEQLRRQANEDAAIDKKSKLSAIQLAEFADKQTKLLEEANRLAESSDARAKNSEEQTRIAKRHAIWANIIAIISLAVAVGQYLGGN